MTTLETTTISSSTTTPELVPGKLYRVVDARYRERLPTIVTTNVDPGAIDPRIRSRLLSGIEVRFSGPDRRVTA